MIKVLDNSNNKRARDYLINESAGDIIITKAVVLAPNYMPKNVIDHIKVLPCNVHVIYNSYVWNVPTNMLSKGELKSHSDIVYDNHISEDKIIGYFVKEGNKILEYRLSYEYATKFLKEDQIELVEEHLKKMRW